MFYFRINKLKIIDNHEKPKYLGLFGPDKAQVKLFSFVTTDETVIPDMDELLATNDEVKKKEIIKKAVKHIASTKITSTIENIKDNHVMVFGDTGYVLFQSDNIPADFNWTILAVESDRDIREIGEEIDGVINDASFDKFTDNLMSIIVSASNPTAAASIAIGKYLTQVTVNRMKDNKDDMIGILYMSLNKREHYPHCERKKDNIPDLTNNMYVDYSIFGFEPK